MIRHALPTLAAAATTLAAVPVTSAAVEVQIQASGPVVELTVTETQAGDPDIATLDAGVTTLAPTAVEAMAQNAARMNALIDGIKAQGIANDDIQTTGISLNPEYEWNDATRMQQFRGYRVMNRVQVKLRRIARAGEVLDALVAAGATDLGGITFGVDDPVPAQDRARRQAMQTAEARALDYARMAGFSGVRLLEVTEGQQQFYGGPIVVTASARAEAAPTPVVPGQVQTGVTVTVKYEMTR